MPALVVANEAFTHESIEASTRGAVDIAPNATGIERKALPRDHLPPLAGLRLVRSARAAIGRVA